MTSALSEKILGLIKETPGLTAREIAAKLSRDKKEVNSILYGPLKGQCTQDEKYKWYLASSEARVFNNVNLDAPIPNSPFGRLCQYYLACLGLDEDAGISVFAANKYGDLDYQELTELPSISENHIFDSDASRKMMGRIRSERGRLAMYLGYPSALKHQRSKKSNWEGFFLEPLLLFPVDFGSSAHDTPKLEMGFPIFNRSALRRLSNAERDAFLEELIQLERELGLTDSDDLPDLDELARRLQSIRPEWPWNEDINPDDLSINLAIPELTEEGIYNKAVLVIGERSPFTQGLEVELKQLSRLSESDLKGTVLGRWLSEGEIPVTSNLEQSLVEVLPLNSEQRQAIKLALTEPLTIITGPPGTGKSQVVTDLLINAAWSGKRVVFASKNNKAVDVVEARVNNIGSRPILLRVGSNQYQTRLAEYLLGLLSSTSTKEDMAAFNEANELHQNINSQLMALNQSEESLIASRNLVDALDQKVGDARSELDSDDMQILKQVDLAPISLAFEALTIAVGGAVKSKQGLITRVFWKVLSAKRFDQVKRSGEELSNQLARLKLKFPEQAPNDKSIDGWESACVLAGKKLALYGQLKEYLTHLSLLQSMKPLEQIAKEQTVLLNKMSDNAQRLWECWLRLQPSKLNQADRQLLQKYSAILKMVVETGPDGTLAKDVYTQYRNLYKKVSHLLPCWAVTSLSARGKVPFEAGFFDLVVFDEASQCDIASALPLLFRAKSAVVIGDPKQLSHISGMPRGHDQQLLQRFNLVEEFPHWAYSYNSLFDLASGFSSGEGIVNLRDHHRSHADIIEFSNHKFYEGRLRVATRYNLLNRPPQEKAGVRWVDIKGAVNKPSSGGAVNEKEAAGVVKILRELVLTKGYRGSIGVVSPFRAQANLIRELALADVSISNLLTSQDFLVDTVHKFQGDERDVIMFSSVVGKGITPGAISFLKNNGNLFNVAVTRARAQLIVVGDLTECSKCDISYLSEFSTYVTKLNDAVETQVKLDLTLLGSEYPSVSNPERVSDWERVFYKALFEAGIKALPQYQVEKYALDFALFAGERRLNIEVDGERYHRNWTGELCRRDQIRNLRMIELGWDVMRFWVYEIRDDMDGCINRIKNWQG